MLAIKSGLTEQQARDSIKLRWAYNAETGAEMGKCPVGYETKALADEWAQQNKRERDIGTRS